MSGLQAFGQVCDSSGCRNVPVGSNLPGYNTDADVAAAYASGDSSVTQYGGSAPNIQGGVTYTAGSNPFLIPDPTGSTAVGGVQHYNQSQYATPAAAAQFARALGGSVIVDPNSASFSQDQPMLAIRLANGRIVNAGQIATILGNDAAWPGATTKSGAIANLIGAAYDPSIAAAVAAGSPVVSSVPSSVPVVAAVPKPASAIPGAAPIVTSSNGVTPGSASAPGSLLSAPVMGIPLWALGAAALGAVFLVGGHR